MRLTGSRVYSRPPPVPKMPPGLVELMEGLTKDVLKNNPTEVYKFCAEHMRKLLEMRDGPSSKKPLSLEQKITKAQETVRNRAEQRWRKLDEDHKLVGDKEGCNQNQDKTDAEIADGNITNNTIKPVHYDDLARDSEIEISCGPNKIEQPQYDADAKQTPTGKGENDNEKNVDQQIKVFDKDEISKELNKQDARDVSCYDQTQKVDNNVLITVEDFNTAEIESKEDKLSVEVLESVNEDPKFTDLSSPVSGDDESKTDTCEKIKDIESRDTNALIVQDNQNTVEEKREDAASASATTFTDFKQSDDNDTLEITRLVENEDEPMSVVEIKDVNEIIIPTGIDNLNKKDNNVADEDEQTLVGEQCNISEGEKNQDLKHEHNKMKSDVESKNEAEDFNTDLEKVKKKAIENIKRKDSSADDSLKDNILGSVKSDGSEGSRLVFDNVTPLNEYAEDNDAKLLVEPDDNQLKETDNNDNSDLPQNHDNTEMPSGMKRSLDDTNIEQPNIASTVQGDLEIVTKKINDSSSVTLAQGSIKEVEEVEDKTSKYDGSNAMDLETAAVTIQKVFRAFLFKSRASTFDESVNEENNLSDDDDKKDDVFLPSNNINKERRTLGISRMDTVLQTVNEEKSLSLSTDDSSLSSAATIIQAHVRGYLLRNKLHSAKSASKNSLGVSNGPSTSLDGDTEQNKSKTVLNIHIVPEGDNYLSRDESMITSMDLSLDGSPPSSVNLHPLGYNKSERRKQLKREDAVQSVSPPSNNSGKLSEDVDSIKELPINDEESNANPDQKSTEISLLKDDSQPDTEVGSLETTPTTSLTVETVVEDPKTSNTEIMSSPEPNADTLEKMKRSLTKQSSDEMDVVTPYKESSSTEDAKLLHSGEFHDTALPTKVSRNDTSPVVSEFKNVLVYFLLWK